MSDQKTNDELAAEVAAAWAEIHRLRWALTDCTYAAALLDEAIRECKGDTRLLRGALEVLNAGIARGKGGAV